MNDRKEEVAPFTVERLEVGTALEVGRSVVLSERDARGLADSVAAAATAGRLLRRRRGAKGLYRIVPSHTLREGLASGELRYAASSRGDASVQVINRKGKFAGRADLRSAATPSAMKLIGPAAWQAMAMATQQHYLVETSGKLSAIDGKLDELIARDEDLKVSGSRKARALAAAVQTTLSSGGVVTPQRREELGVLLRRIDDDWRELWVRTDRLLKAYQTESSDQEERSACRRRMVAAAARDAGARGDEHRIRCPPARSTRHRLGVAARGKRAGRRMSHRSSGAGRASPHRSRLRASDADPARRQPHQQPGRAGASEGHENATALRARLAGRPARGDRPRAG